MKKDMYKDAKIVIIDDVEEVLKSTKNCLEFEDMQVVTFNNPIEGLEYLKTNKVDVLLLDFFMPQMNGDIFVEELRKYNQETIIILQTGYADKIPPLDMIDKMNIQGYLDKLKGEDELLLMTKAAIKTSFLNKEIREKDKEIAKLNFKKAITGNLIVRLVNEAKDQLMQISGMNSVIADNEDYKIEANGITSALERTYQLYEALNFETLNEIDLRGLKDIISILLKPTLLINSASLQFDINDEGIIINNASNKIYIIIKALEILTRNDAKSIILKMDENKFKICFDKEVNVDLLNDLKILADNIEINTNQISF